MPSVTQLQSHMHESVRQLILTKFRSQKLKTIHCYHGLGDPEVHYRIYKSMPLHTVSSASVHNLTSYLFKINFNPFKSEALS